jgi:hypothetical protein
MTVKNLKESNADLGWDVDQSTFLLKGDPDNLQDGDLRIVTNAGNFILQQYKADCACFVSAGMEISSTTLRVGLQGGVTGFGSSVGFSIARDSGVYYAPPAVGISKAGQTFPLGVGIPVGAAEYVVSTAGTDDLNAVLVDGEYVLSTLAGVFPAGGYVWSQYLSAGNTAPTAPVIFSVYEGTDDTDITKRLINVVVPPEAWDGKAFGDDIKFNFSELGDIEIPILGRPEFNYFLTCRSAAPFSLQADGTDFNNARDQQLAEFLYVQFDNYVEVSSDIEHIAPVHYAVDTTAGIVNIDIPDGVINSFTVWDAKKKFGTNKCFINIKDAGGATIHSAELDKRNEAWQFYFDGAVWKYAEIGRGEFVSIASAHRASTDFPDDYINAYLSTTLSLSSSTEKTIPFDTVIDSSGITNAAGEFTLSEAGIYRAEISTYVDELGDPTVYFWAEYKESGGSWAPVTDSLHKNKMLVDGTRTLSIITDVELGDGCMFRVRGARSSEDVANLTGQSYITDTGTVYQRAAKISLKKIN